MLIESVSLEDALGRVFAQNAVSNINIPSYDKTFIDGYAIDPKDTVGASTAKPVAFKAVGKLFPADYPTDAKVASGEAIYVACGAPIPKGATSTVKAEETRLNGDKIEVVREIKPGEGAQEREFAIEEEAIAERERGSACDRSRGAGRERSKRRGVQISYWTSGWLRSVHCGRSCRS